MQKASSIKKITANTPQIIFRILQSPFDCVEVLVIDSSAVVKMLSNREHANNVKHKAILNAKSNVER
jgi:hypothetical protein